MSSFIESVLFPPRFINAIRQERAIAGKTILITGASRGIGEATARLIASSECHLILVSRSEDKLKEVAAACRTLGAKVDVLAVDLRAAEAVTLLLDFVRSLALTIDIFISNAGKSIHRPLLHSLDRYHDVTRTQALNYEAPVRLMLSLLPELIANRGQLINVSAANVLLPPAPHWSAYQGSKAAMDGWFRSASPELGAQGVRATTLYFPLVRTEMIAPTKAYDRVPALSPEGAARLIVSTIIHRRRSWQPWWIAPARCLSLLMGRRLWETLCEHYIKRSER